MTIKARQPNSVRAFQRAVSDDKVNAVIASYISEVVLALEPWAARLKTVMITPGAASNEISAAIHKDYERNKYTFHGYLTSSAQAQSVCDIAKSVLVDARHMKSAVIFSEDAAWTTPLDSTYEECLPKAGLKVLDHIRFSPDTTDFTPIFNKIEGEKPDVIITGISHVGVQPTVQWANQQVPIPMLGIASQATNSTFWKDTNGAAEGVLFEMFAAPETPVMPKTVPFANVFKARFGNFPAYSGSRHTTRSIISRMRSRGPDRRTVISSFRRWKRPIGKARSAEFNSTEEMKSLPIPSNTVLGLSQAFSWNGTTESSLRSGQRSWPTEQISFPNFIKLPPS